MYNTLKGLIDQYIIENTSGEITGEILNNILNQMVSVLGSGSKFKGSIQPDSEAPSGTEGENDYFYIATSVGTYTNFGDITVSAGELAFVKKEDSSWVKYSWDISSLLSGKQDTISDLATIRSGASAGATAYQKPQSGIPKTDLASDVQTSLGKADTALQQHQDISGKADKSDTYTKSEVDAKVTSVMRYKGSVNNYAALSAIQNPSVGDVYNVLDTGHNYAYDGTSWDVLSGIVSVDGKADKVSNATNGNFAGLDANGNITDSGKKASDFATAAQGTKADTALQSFTETDPTVPSWAKQPNKPLYAYSEIGNTPDLSGFITKSVNDLTNYYLKSETYTKAEVDEKMVRVYKPAGNATLATLGSLDASHEGFTYNMTEGFTTTADFVEGAGKDYPAGSNVAIVNTGTVNEPVYKYDVLACDAEIDDSTVSPNKTWSSEKIKGEIDVIKDADYTKEVLTLQPDRYYTINIGNSIQWSSNTATSDITCARIAVKPGDVFKIYGNGGNSILCLYGFADSSYHVIEVSANKLNTRDSGLVITAPNDAAYLCINFNEYNAATDRLMRYVKSLPLLGKNIVVFGDSISEISKDGKTWCDWAEEITGANIINVAIGGSQLKRRGSIIHLFDDETQCNVGDYVLYKPSTTMNRYRCTTAHLGAWDDADFTEAESSNVYANLDMVSVVDAVTTHSFVTIEDVEAAAEYVKDHNSDDNTAIIGRLAAIDWTSVDIVLIVSGTNDFRLLQYGTPESVDVETTLGAINVMVNKLCSTYKKIDLRYVSSLVHWYDYENLNPDDWGDVYVPTGGTMNLREYVHMLLAQFQKHHIPTKNLYDTLGWNKYNFSEFFNSNDGSHPYKGLAQLGTEIGDFLMYSNNELTEFGKQDKTEIVTPSAATLTQQMADNTIYNANELTALTITLPSTIEIDYISQINFTSGSTATQLTAPVTIVWDGDSINTDGEFEPEANMRYTVMLYSDGTNVLGIVRETATQSNNE